MKELDERPTLADLQRYVAEIERERGFAEQCARDKCLLLGEELGELFRAVRRAEGLAVDCASRVADVGEELADCLIYLCAVANRYGVNLETAFRAKEEQNRGREWTAPPRDLGPAADAGRADPNRRFG